MLSSIAKNLIGWLSPVGTCGLSVHLQRTFQRGDEEYTTAEQRILYMEMSLACEKLHTTYLGKLPRPYEGLRRQNLVDFVG